MHIRYIVILILCLTSVYGADDYSLTIGDCSYSTTQDALLFGLCSVIMLAASVLIWWLGIPLIDIFLGIIWCVFGGYLGACFMLGIVICILIGMGSIIKGISGCF